VCTRRKTAKPMPTSRRWSRKNLPSCSWARSSTDGQMVSGIFSTLIFVATDPRGASQFCFNLDPWHVRVQAHGRGIVLNPNFRTDLKLSLAIFELLHGLHSPSCRPNTAGIPRGVCRGPRLTLTPSVDGFPGREKFCEWCKSCHDVVADVAHSHGFPSCPLFRRQPQMQHMTER
jgi:hypothetical protein